jgi:hypothetical protein
VLQQQPAALQLRYLQTCFGDRDREQFDHAVPDPDRPVPPVPDLLETPRLTPEPPTAGDRQHVRLERDDEP